MPVPVLCNPLIDPACAVVGTVIRSGAQSAGSGILNSIAQAVTEGIRWTVVNTASWWVQLPSPNLGAEPAVTRVQQWLLPIAAAVAIGGVIAAGLRMAITRRANPLLDLGGGLLAIAAATTIGAAAAALLLRAGDAWSAWVLQTSSGGQFSQRLSDILDLGPGAAPVVVVIFGVIAMFFALVQAVLMLFRQAALVILAGVLPLAAAGTIAPATRPWLRKVTSWMLALICYKPAAAAVYATAFTLAGSKGSSTTALMGFAMIALSVFTLPALMKFFTWTTGSVGGGGGGGGQIFGAAAMGAMAVGALRSPGSSGSAAQGQATYLTSQLGSSGSSNGPATGAAAPGPASAAAGHTGASPPPWTAPPAGTGTTAAGAAPAAGGSTSAAQATAAAGAASGAAGPATAAASQAAQSAARTVRLATGAMEPGDDQ